LNEKQRTAKRKLIEENRERRKDEQTKVKVKETYPDQDVLSDTDRGLICEVVTAYEYTAGKNQNSSKVKLFYKETVKSLLKYDLRFLLW
jgi:hypothetical protein